MGYTPSATELVWVRVIGAMALALGVGCWYARTGDRPVVQMMSGLMILAKGLSTIIFLIYLVNGTLTPFMWVNFALVAILAVWNGWQFWAAQAG